ncbi:transcription elongation factor B polypeptide 1 family protein, partial [Oesophagostomum dentatum]
ELAYVSRTIRAMMEGPIDDHENLVHFRSIPSHILQKVCHYFLYKNRYEDSDKTIPDFPIEPQLSLELLMAANFLDC